MKKWLLWLMLVLLVPFCACAQEQEIYLYGEQHGVPAILQSELEYWHGYYQTGMRHLFVELPWYTAEFLNQWMHSEDDRIFDQLYQEWEGTAMQGAAVRAFYQGIKTHCPETVFHGTDVGHQYYSTGERYLEQLKQQGLEGTEDWKLALQAVEQGKCFYETRDDAYREVCMADNFIREWERVNDSVMGIYGSAHIIPTGQNMVSMLQNRMDARIVSEDLSWMARELEPVGEQLVTIGPKQYRALCFGTQDISSWAAGYLSRTFYRLEDAYEDFRSLPVNGNVLPDDNYPMNIQPGQVFMIDYTLANGAVDRQYYRHDGGQWQGKSTTVQVLID